MTSEREAYVYIQLPGSFEAVPAARLRVQTQADGVQLGRLRYGDRYLQRPDAVALDPFQLPLAKDVFTFTRLKGLPGAVRDAGPDAWGRRVIEHKLERSAADLDEIDYLLHGPQDGAGNLSFGLKVDPPAPRRSYNRTHQLAELIKAAEAIEAGERVDPHLLETLDAGTSMGGARPKATIEDAGKLWLGKFPADGDRFDIQRAEFATLELARRCGLNVAHARLESVGTRDVLMLERFDRQYDERRDGSGYLRFGFVSGLTVLDAGDSHLDRDRWSYPLLADNLRRWSEKPVVDCAELFDRMVFNAAVTNNDDHPRNHAMLRRQGGWRLSPAYDLVPTPMISLERRDLALTVGRYGRTASIVNLASQAGRFGLSVEDARHRIDRIAAVVGTWREVFQHCGVSAKDIEHIASAMLPECFFFDAPPPQ